jgi:hypothetical protein
MVAGQYSNTPLPDSHCHRDHFVSVSLAATTMPTHSLLSAALCSGFCRNDATTKPGHTKEGLTNRETESRNTWNYIQDAAGHRAEDIDGHDPATSLVSAKNVENTMPEKHRAG